MADGAHEATRTTNEAAEGIAEITDRTTVLHKLILES
jgi:hypothetical protein